MRNIYRKFHKLAEKHTADTINDPDSLLFIPALTIRKSVHKSWEWNINASINNEKHATWDNLDYKKRMPKEYLFINNQIIKYYEMGGTLKTVIRKVKYKNVIYHSNSHPDRKQLLEMVKRYKPDGVFTVYNIPGWFFIIGERIAFIEWTYQELFYHEDGLFWLKYYFTQKDFMPVFSGQEI